MLSGKYPLTLSLPREGGGNTAIGVQSIMAPLSYLQ